MGVFDRELIINGEAVRSPEQQVYKNMKDIQALQQIVKKMYKTSEELTEASVSVAIADTNAPDGTTEGWLITEDGLLFNITGGDESNLLLAYYSDLKGPQGDAGPAGTTAINDNATALDSTWSSQKITDVLQIDMLFATTRYTIFYTKTTPTLNGDYYEITKSDLLNPQSSDEKNYIARQVILLDNDNKVKEIYSIEDFEETSPYTLKLTFRGTFVDKQLYQHNITGVYSTIKLLITIINDSNTQLNASSILQWLKEKGFRNDNYQGIYYHEAKLIQSGSLNACQITYNSDTQLGYMLFSGTGSALTLGDLTITDTVAKVS